jgi:hypothetical protein
VLEDLPWWPRVFRVAETGNLATAERFAKRYTRIVPRLAAALANSSNTLLIDLCSGSGPWSDSLPALRTAGVDATVCLTDRYPNTAALAKAAELAPGIRFEPEAVNTLVRPKRLTGIRTAFTAFHHSSPENAKRILESAVRDRQDIAIFEATARTPATLASMFLVPLSVWFLPPLVRPFHCPRLF